MTAKAKNSLVLNKCLFDISYFSLSNQSINNNSRFDKYKQVLILISLISSHYKNPPLQITIHLAFLHILVLACQLNSTPFLQLVLFYLLDSHSRCNFYIQYKYISLCILSLGHNTRNISLCICFLGMSNLEKMLNCLMSLLDWRCARDSHITNIDTLLSKIDLLTSIRSIILNILSSCRNKCLIFCEVNLILKLNSSDNTMERKEKETESNYNYKKDTLLRQSRHNYEFQVLP